MEKEQAKYPEFPAPEGFVPPPEIEPGEEFEALGTFKMKDDGRVCLVAMDGVPVTSKPAEPAQAQEEETFASVMKKELPGVLS